MPIKLNHLKGIVLCLIIALLAKWINKALAIGAVTLAILIGMIIRNTIKLPTSFTPGIVFSEKKILSLAIICLGVNLNYTVIQNLGFQTVLMIVTTLTITLLTAILLGRRLGFSSKMSWLIGIGSGVCGSAAIAASEKIIDANEADVGLSIASINFLGTLGLFALPFLGTALFQNNHASSGVLIGNTLQAVGHVVASGFALGPAAGQTALIVKMVRVLMLTPLIFVLIALFSKRTSKTTNKKLNVPFFIVGFVLFSLIPTFKLLPGDIIQIISQTGKYLLMIAMAGIGLKITFSNLLKQGKEAILLGSLVFLVQIAMSGLAVYFLF